MINIIYERCEAPNWMKYSNYGNTGDQLPKFCKDHAI